MPTVFLLDSFYFISINENIFYGFHFTYYNYNNPDLRTQHSNVQYKKWVFILRFAKDHKDLLRRHM